MLVGSLPSSESIFPTHSMLSLGTLTVFVNQMFWNARLIILVYMTHNQKYLITKEYDPCLENINQYEMKTNCSVSAHIDPILSFLSTEHNPSSSKEFGSLYIIDLYGSFLTKGTLNYISVFFQALCRYLVLDL